MIRCCGGLGRERGGVGGSRCDWALRTEFFSGVGVWFWVFLGVIGGGGRGGWVGAGCVSFVVWGRDV